MKETRLPPTRFNVGIYSVLEGHLRAAKSPLTCGDLVECADVQRFTKDANRISNYLGHMWRKGLLIRHAVPASHLSMSRFAYTWKPEDEKPKVIDKPAFVLKGKNEGLDVTVERQGNLILIEHAAFKLTIQLKDD